MVGDDVFVLTVVLVRGGKTCGVELRRHQADAPELVAVRRRFEAWKMPDDA